MFRFCFVRLSMLSHFSVLVKSAKCDVSSCSMLLILFVFITRWILLLLLLLLFAAIELSLGGSSPYTSIQNK